MDTGVFSVTKRTNLSYPTYPRDLKDTAHTTHYLKAVDYVHCVCICIIRMSPLLS